MSRSLRSFSLVVLALFVVVTGGCDGCDPSSAVPDAGLDAGGEGEGEGEDDAGVVDAGFDAGVVEDAGFDAGVVVVDAGFDAGVVDAGFDGGVLDAGFDGGPPLHACTSTRDCAGALVCSDLRDEGDAVVPWCRALDDDASLATLAPCEASDECATSLCLPRAGTCSVACVEAADCGAGGACTAYPFAPDSGGATWLGICAAACASDEDCPSGRVCTYNGNPLTNAFDAICERPAGAGELGAACDGDAECVSGLCLADRCSRVCEDASDCTGGVSGNGMTACEDVEVFDPAGTGSAFLRLCR